MAVYRALSHMSITICLIKKEEINCKSMNKTEKTISSLSVRAERVLSVFEKLYKTY